MILEEGSTNTEISRVLKMITRSPKEKDEIVFEDISTRERKTVKNATQIFTTGVYACFLNALSNATAADTVTFEGNGSAEIGATGWYLGDSDCSDLVAPETTFYTKNDAKVTFANLTSSITLEEKSSSASDGAIIGFTINGSKDGVEISVTDTSTNVTGGEDDEREVGYYLSDFGTYVVVDTEDKDDLTVYVPSEKVTYDVSIASSDAVTTTSGDTGINVYKDSETANFAGKNLIVVGGSAINAIAAELLGGAYAGEEFTAETGVAAGQFLIESKNRDGKIALLVAGYNAEDTSKAVTYLTNTDDVDTTVGTKYVGSSATEATLVVN